MEYKEYELGELLYYEQPTPYIVESTDYNDTYETPVLTAGKSFILGYTDEKEGIYDQLPVIIFDDFTTASQYVNFKFKVKSSAMKILTPVTELVLPKYIYYRIQIIQFDHSTHKRYWIQQYSKIRVSIPPIPEQECIVARIEELFSQLDAGVETLKKTKAQLAVYRQAVLKEAFEGRLTIHVPVNLPLSWESSDETNTLPAIPEEWHYIALKYLGDLGRGKSKHRPRNDPKLFVDGKYPFIQTGDVKAATNCITLIPVKQYYSERKGELNSLNSEIASIYWHKPCEEMYTKLQLKYLKGSNSAFVDGAGELVCFESSELIGNDTGFYIRYDKLLEFLKSSSYTLVWTSLCEKRILTPSFGRWDLPPKAIHMSSVYYLKDGKIAKASETLFEDRLYY